MSSNPSVQSIVLQSTSALPLTSVRSLLHHIAGFSFTCQFTLRRLLSDASDGHPALESKIDRVSRAFLRFPGEEDEASQWNCLACVPFHVTSRLRGRFSPDVYAQLLCLQHGTNHLDEIRELLLSNLPEEGIVLEPIVWARLLHKLLPFGPDDRDIALYFFEIIPSNYWNANFVVPPPVYEWEEIKIIKNANSTADHLRSTVHNYLYPWVGDSIIQGKLNVTDSIFNPESPDDYPSPQDPRLRFLLTIVGSPSIQRTGIDLPSGNIFRKAISEIETFFRIDHLFYIFQSSLPIVEFNNHRHAILKLLYMLLSSDHFGKREVPVERQHAALVLFLRMVEFTFPLPPFMARNWCTPGLAAEFVRIAFEDGSWTSIDPPDRLYELLHCLVQFPPIMNQAFEYAGAMRLFDRLVEKLHYSHGNPFDCIHSSYIPTVLEMFITGLPPSNLEPQICQKFLGYLHEPDTLFAVCAFLVGDSDDRTLHGLASLCPDDPAWPVCLQRLREYAYPPRLSDRRNIPGILADLTTFIEGGGVGSFGRTAPSGAEQIAQVDDSSVDSPKDTWRNAWRRVQRYITNGAAHEDMALSSIGTV
ncbi:hypothetical protein ARMSODRAFT_1016307 [Armillaria solidipes]|uniref:Uncharacterized protein n=1 Tax=Armillaria solidipes TaxID=1076256 RepID=A0A2H3C1Z5_9AGAR|nr:hypothetical protein ARMSODRAFT_1016307 [Armillaria solidipes]